jgi:hypothetical protein
MIKNNVRQKLTAYLDYVKKYICWDDSMAKDFTDRFASIWKEKIMTGVSPPLKPATIAYKKKKGYPHPTTPLVATGGLLNSVTVGKLRKNKGLLDIVSRNEKSKVKASWHVTKGHQAPHVPLRIPIPRSLANRIFNDWMNESGLKVYK